MNQMYIKELNSDIGGVSWSSVSMDAEAYQSDLSDKILAAGLPPALVPRKRSFSDAMRLALGKISSDSAKVDADGSKSMLIVTNIPRVKGCPVQKWGVNRRVLDVQNQTIDFPTAGYVELHDDGTVVASEDVVPGGSDAVAALAAHYVESCDHTKLRSFIAGVYDHLKAIHLGSNGIHILGSDKVKFLAETVVPIFSVLLQGSVNITALTVADTPVNKAALKKDLEACAREQLDGIKAAILEYRKSNEGVTASVVKKWIDTVAALQENMSLFGALDAKVPSDLDDLDNQLLMLESEITEAGSKRKKARRVIEMDSAEEATEA